MTPIFLEFQPVFCLKVLEQILQQEEHKFLQLDALKEQRDLVMTGSSPLKFTEEEEFLLTLPVSCVDCELASIRSSLPQVSMLHCCCILPNGMKDDRRISSDEDVT